jgi:uncharacterized protein Yka (UPF0111/DUF47 family)
LNGIVGRVKGFFIPGEKNAFQRVQELATLAEESLQILGKLLSSTHNGREDVEKWVERITVLEREGDQITQSFEEMLGKGAISASLLTEFDRLIDDVDSVLDRAHSLSRQLRRVVRRPLRDAKEFDAIIRKGQEELVQIGLVQLCTFKQLLDIVGTDRTKATDLAKEIERLEEKGDDVKDGMLDEIYGSWEILDYAQFHNYLETTIEADDILDLCEDASDVVMIVMKALGG